MTRGAKENRMTGYLPYDAHLARVQELRTRAATHRRARRDEAPLPEGPTAVAGTRTIALEACGCCPDGHLPDAVARRVAAP
jgi:hypothetical protein